MEKRQQEKELLIEWLEEFKSKYGGYKESQSTIEECEKIIARCETSVSKYIIPLKIQNRLNERNKKSGSTLKHEIEAFIAGVKQLSSKYEGVSESEMLQNMEEREISKIRGINGDYLHLLEEMEEFKYLFAAYEEGKAVIGEIEEYFEEYKKVKSKVKTPIELNEVKRQKKSFNKLEYGFNYHFSQFKSELNKPVQQINLGTIKESYNQLLEWFEEFKLKFSEEIIEENPLVLREIKEMEEQFEKYNQILGKLLVPREIESKIKARTEKHPHTIEYSINQLYNELLSNSREYGKIKESFYSIIEWIEEFKIKYRFYLNEIDAKREQNPLLEGILEKIEKITEKYSEYMKNRGEINKMEKELKSNKVLEYGIEYELKKIQENFVNKNLGGKYLRKSLQNVLLWLDDFKMKYSFFEEGKKNIQRIEESLNIVKKHFPKEYSESFLAVKENKSISAATKGEFVQENKETLTRGGMSEEKDDDEDEIPLRKKLAPTNAQNQQFVEPEFKTMVDEDESDVQKEETAEIRERDGSRRDYPADIIGNQSLEEEVNKKQNQLADKLSKKVPIDIDWSFIDSGEFASKEENDKKQICQKLGYSITSKMICSDDGLFGVISQLQSASTASFSLLQLINRKLNRITMKYASQLEEGAHGDEERVIIERKNNQINYLLRLNSIYRELTIEIEFGTWNASFNSEISTNKILFNQFSELFRIPFEKMIFSDFNLQLKTIENTLNKNIQRKTNPIQLKTNKNQFITFGSFQHIQEDKGTDEHKIKYLQLFLYGIKSFILPGNGGLCELIEKNVTVKKLIFENIQEIKFEIYENENEGKNIRNMNEYKIKYNKNLNQIKIEINFELIKKITEKQGGGLKDIEEKVDRELGLVVLKSIDSSIVKIQSYENIIKRKINFDLIVEILWDKWVYDSENYLEKYTSENQIKINKKLMDEQMNEIINAKDGFIEFYQLNQPFQAVLNRKFKRFQFYYDAKSKINQKSYKNTSFYSLKYDYTHCTLKIRGNLSQQKDLWKDFQIKFKPIVETAKLRFDIEKQLRQTNLNKLNNIKSHKNQKLDIKIDWDSFVNEESFLSKQAAARLDEMNKIPNKAITNLILQLTGVASNPIGQKAIAEQLNRFIIRSPIKNVKKEQEKELDWSEFEKKQYYFNKNSKVFFLSKEKLIESWEIREALNVLIAVAKNIGESHIKSIPEQVSEKLEKVIPVEFSWAFLNDKNFLALHSLKILERIETLSSKLLTAIYFERGILGVCSHPIGKRAILEKIHKIKITFQFNRNKQKNDEPEINYVEEQGILDIQINESSVFNSVKTRYKERIEFIFDLIVAIAKDNAEGNVKAIESELEKVFGKKLPVNIELLNFIKLNDFKEKQPAEQADIITNLYTKLANAIVASQDIGVFSIFKKVSSFPGGVAKWNTLVDAIQFSVDPENKSDKQANIELNNKILKFQFNLDDVCSTSIRITNWRERILFITGFLVDFSSFECLPEKTEIENALKHSYGKESEIRIDFSHLVQTNDFLHYHPTEQVKIIKSINTNMLRQTLLGDAGFTGSRGLCEFEQTIAQLKTHFTSIRFIPVVQVDNKFHCANGELIIKYSLAQINQEQYNGCHHEVENFFNLRKTKENAAIQRAENKIKSDCAGRMQVTINWNAFVGALKIDEYVRVVDEVADFPKKILFAENYSFGSVGLFTFADANASLASALSAFSHISIEFDPNNQTAVHVGNSRALNPSCFVVQTQKPNLIIKTNLSNRKNPPGVGRVVQFTLCKGEAEAEESRTVNKIAERMARDEQNDRERQIDRAKRENEQIQKDNKRDQENYKREMEQYKQ